MVSDKSFVYLLGASVIRSFHLLSSRTDHEMASRHLLMAHHLLRHHLLGQKLSQLLNTSLSDLFSFNTGAASFFK